jgi:hypothetical protein
VPGRIDDNGVKFGAEMLAGSTGIIHSSSGEEDAESLIGLDTIEPFSGWWMYGTNVASFEAVVAGSLD